MQLTSAVVKLMLFSQVRALGSTKSIFSGYCLPPAYLNANFIWDVTENTSPCDSKVAASIPTPGHSPAVGHVNTEIVFKNPITTPYLVFVTNKLN